MNFISSLYLWLLPLISLPIIIYLFNRSRYRTILFSSIKFLNQINKKSIKKVNLINLLLILIRTLIILFFILMMSRPFYNATYDSSKDISSVALIAVDNSLSMHNNIDKNINNIILKIVEPLNDNIRVIIFTLDDYKVLYDNKKNDINLNLLNIRKTYRSNSLRRIDELIGEYNDYLNKYLFIVSDGQENLITNNFKTENNNWHINYINARKSHTNLSIIDVETDNNLILANDIFQITVNVKNTGYKNINNQLIELFINNINIGKRYVDIPANTSKQIFFDLTIPSYGEHLCSIEAEDDDINIDNIFYFTIDLKENIDIDIIDNSNNTYLKNILTSFNISNSIVKPNYYNLENYINSNTRNEILFILGLNNLTEDLSFKINQKLYLDKMKVIVFPNLLDKNFLYLKNILPELEFENSYRRIVGDSQYLEIDTESIQEKNFRDIYSNNTSRNIKVFNYIKMDPDTNTIMILNNNDMFLNQYEKDNNITILLSSISLDLNSTNYPLKGNILPFFKNLIMDYKLIQYYDNNTINEKSKYFNNSTIITSPLNQQFVFNANKKTEFTELGFYTITDDYKKNYFSLNINRSEKISPFLNNEQIKSLMPKQTYISQNPSEISENIKKVQIGYDLWIILFCIIILLIIAEMYLSTSIIKND